MSSHAADTFSEKYSAGAFRMAMTVKGGRIPVRVFNYLNKPLKIYRCSSIGDLYPLDGEGESQQETNGGVGYKVVPPGAPNEDVEIGLEAKQCSAVFVKDADVHNLSVEEMFPIAVISSRKRKNLGFMTCCPLMPTAFQRDRGI